MKPLFGLFGRHRHEDEKASAPTPEEPPTPGEAAESQPATDPVATAPAAAPYAPPPAPEAVLDAMHDVIDPELGYNIVDIGLIYECHARDGVVQIVMTMTTPGCPAQDYIMNGVYDRGGRIPGVRNMRVELVWDPPWSTDKMTPVAKAHFRIPAHSA